MNALLETPDGAPLEVDHLDGLPPDVPSTLYSPLGVAQM